MTHDTKVERENVVSLTRLGPQSRFGGKSLKFQVICPQNGTTVLKGLSFIFTNPPEDKNKNENKCYVTPDLSYDYCLKIQGDDNRWEEGGKNVRHLRNVESSS